jgi:hypothetical protein
MKLSIDVDRHCSAVGRRLSSKVANAVYYDVDLPGPHDDLPMGARNNRSMRLLNRKVDVGMDGNPKKLRKNNSSSYPGIFLAQGNRAVV